MKSILIRLSGLSFAMLTLVVAVRADAPATPLLLFMQPSDTRDPVGLLTFDGNPLISRGRITGTGADTTIDFRALLAVPQPDGSCLVFGCRSEELPGQPKNFLWRLYRARTSDGYHFSDVKEVYRNPKGPWLIEASMARQATTGRLFFYPWSRSEEPEQGHALWGFVSDDGEQWRPLADKPVYLDHDAFGMMWDERTGRFLTGQVTHQPWKKPYADNMGGSVRRVLQMRTSQDGVHWETAGKARNDGLITPDSQDTPDVEFYRMQPFAYGDRYISMTDLYAASPLTPAKHGPHLTCEWWVSADGIDWHRPWRSVAAQADAPYPIKMTPMWFGRDMLFWIGSEVWGLPEYRIAGIGSRSNAEFSSPSFSMPGRALLLNAAVPRGHGLFNQSYVQAELRDDSNKTIPGYERDKCLLQNIDETRIPLKWGERTGKELAGQKVTLRFCLRSAHIYALGVER